MTQGVVKAGRRAAERRMTSTVKVERSTGERDPLTGDYVRRTVYDGKARVMTFEAFEQNAEVAGATVVVQRYYVHVPVSAGKFEPGDVITVTASDNPLLVGNTYRVAGTHEKNDQTAQRLLVDHI